VTQWTIACLGGAKYLRSTFMLILVSRLPRRNFQGTLHPSPSLDVIVSSYRNSTFIHTFSSPPHPLFLFFRSYISIIDPPCHHAFCFLLDSPIYTLSPIPVNSKPYMIEQGMSNSFTLFCLSFLIFPHSQRNDNKWDISESSMLSCLSLHDTLYIYVLSYTYV
jgi:hypothetical protein